MAAMVSVPVLNLLTPLFGAAFMVRVFKRLPEVAADPRRLRGGPARRGYDAQLSAKSP